MSNPNNLPGTTGGGVLEKARGFLADYYRRTAPDTNMAEEVMRPNWLAGASVCEREFLATIAKALTATSSPVLVEELDLAHRDMATAIAFLGRGPRPAKLGEPAPAENWAAMCSELADLLAKADNTALAALRLSRDDGEGLS